MRKFYVYFIIFSLIIFAFILNKVADKFVLKDKVSEIEMTGVELYSYNNNSKVFQFVSDKCEFNYNFNRFKAYNVNGKYYLPNYPLNFKSDVFSYSKRHNTIETNNFVSKIQNNEFTAKSAMLDLNTNFIEASEGIEYKSKFASGNCETCYIDLNNKLITLKQSELYFDTNSLNNK